jgi:hypothetical protein
MASGEAISHIMTGIASSGPRKTIGAGEHPQSTRRNDKVLTGVNYVHSRRSP